MANHVSATVCLHTPHVTETTRTATVINALKRRAQAVLNDPSIDPRSRAIIRNALQTHDPWLAELVRRADAGETIVDTVEFAEIPEANTDDSHEARIDALAELICRAGDEPDTKSAALVVLMARVENSAHPKALANTVKQSAFTRCAEMNLYGIVDAQIDAMERELFANSHLS